MTEPTPKLSEEAQQRIDRLNQRRSQVAAGPDSAPARKAKRRRTATGSRIAALGLGGTTMFGIVAGLALADSHDTQPPTLAPVATTQARPITVIIHQSSSVSQPSEVVDTTQVIAVEQSTPVPAQPAELASIEMRAQPVVQTIEVQGAAPAGKAAPAQVETSGS